MSDAIITVEGLDKKYRLGAHTNERYTALRDVIAQKTAGVFQKLKPGKRKSGNGSSDFSSQLSNFSSSPEDFWALRDVSFEVKQGEILGIIERKRSMVPAACSGKQAALFCIS